MVILWADTIGAWKSDAAILGSGIAPKIIDRTSSEMNQVDIWSPGIVHWNDYICLIAFDCKTNRNDIKRYACGPASVDHLFDGYHLY